MRKLLVAALAALFMLGGIQFAMADPPGPNGNNDHGLCTAYFNGQKKGHDKKGEDNYPPPFAGLKAVGEAYTDSDGVDNDRDGEVDEPGEHESLSAAENICNFCNDTSTIGGNPEHGRYTCSDPGATSDPECTENEDPGGGNG